MSKFSKSGLIVLFLIAFSFSIYADPIRITSGQVTIGATGTPTPTGSTSVNISMNLVSGNTVFSAAGQKQSPYTNLLIGAIVQPGTTLPSTFNLMQYSLGGSGGVGGGDLTINGVKYFNVTYSPSTLNFTYLQPLVVPNFAGNSFSVSIPFIMTGTLLPGCVNSIGTNQSCETINGVAYQVSGNGTATLFFQRDSNGNIIMQQAKYEFSNTEPTPEPATLLLFGSGLAGLAGYAAKRRKKKAEPEA